MVGFCVWFLVIILKYILPRGKRSIQKSFELKKLVQEIISSANVFFKKENIDPEKYPLKLKYNDYVGIDYVGRKKYLKKEYSAYLNLEENIPVLDTLEEEIDNISSKLTYMVIVGTVILVTVTIFIVMVLSDIR